MSKYHARKVTYSHRQWFFYILPRLLIVPLIWDGLAYLANWLIGEALSKLILPAQSMGLPSSFNYPKDGKNLAYHKVILQDGTNLDTIEYSHPSQQSKPASDKTYIINFLGNATMYEDVCSQFESDSNKLQCNVVGFNFRGVGRSRGVPKSKNDLVEDAIAQVQRLLDAGVTPHHITLKGHSLGASIATLTAAHFHWQGININLFNGRSFSSLTHWVLGKVRVINTDNRHEPTLTGKVLAWLLTPIIKITLLLSGWEINAEQAYKSIPEKHREYLVVRSPDEHLTNNTLDDTVIPYYASIHSALKRSDRHEQSKFVVKGSPWLDGHNVHLEELNQTSLPGLNGSLFFRSFVRRVSEVKLEKEFEVMSPMNVS